MDTCSVFLTFEFVDEILLYGHSNETFLVVLLHGLIFVLALLGVKKLSGHCKEGFGPFEGTLVVIAVTAC